jgi:hypothetical protein
MSGMPSVAIDGHTPSVAQIEPLLAQLRMIAQRCARDAATFIHPQLAQVKRDHRREDGELIKPVIEITGLAALGTVPDTRSWHTYIFAKVARLPLFPEWQP